MKALLGLCCVGLLAGCAVTQDIADTAVRDEAKSVASSVIGQEFPGVDAEPIADCIVDNATTQEILTIATGSIGGPTQATVDAVLSLAQRQEVVTCVLQIGIEGFGV
jgi:hypothetical protein